MRGCLCIFVYIWIVTLLLGCRTIHQILWFKVFLDSRLQYKSLEGLMDFLAFLVQKLWQNKHKLIREIPRNYSAMSSMIWGLAGGPSPRWRYNSTLVVLTPPTSRCKELDDEGWDADLDLALHLFICWCKLVVLHFAKSWCISQLHNVQFTFTVGSIMNINCLRKYKMKLSDPMTHPVFIPFSILIKITLQFLTSICIIE